MATLAQARAKMSKLGVTLKVVREYHATVKKGRVIRTIPKAGTWLYDPLKPPAVVTVTLYVSKGKKPQ